MSGVSPVARPVLLCCSVVAIRIEMYVDVYPQLVGGVVEIVGFGVVESVVVSRKYTITVVVRLRCITTAVSLTPNAIINLNLTSGLTRTWL